jgi:hypothetical protein
MLEVWPILSIVGLAGLLAGVRGIIWLACIVRVAIDGNASYLPRFLATCHRTQWAFETRCLWHSP